MLTPLCDVPCEGAFTHRNPEEVGLIHDIEDHLPHFAVVHREVVIGVLPLFDPEQIHHASQSFRNDPDPIVGKAVKLAGLHTFLPKLPTVLPLVLLRGLKRNEDLKYATVLQETISLTLIKVHVTHPARDALDLSSAERLKVHADVPFHGCEELLGGAVGGVGLFPPVALVPAGDDPLVFTAKHVEIICLRQTTTKKKKKKKTLREERIHRTIHSLHVSGCLSTTTAVY